MIRGIKVEIRANLKDDNYISFYSTDPEKEIQ